MLQGLARPPEGSRVLEGHRRPQDCTGGLLGHPRGHWGKTGRLSEGAKVSRGALIDMQKL